MLSKQVVCLGHLRTLAWDPNSRIMLGLKSCAREFTKANSRTKKCIFAVVYSIENTRNPSLQKSMFFEKTQIQGNFYFLVNAGSTSNQEISVLSLYEKSIPAIFRHPGNNYIRPDDHALLSILSVKVSYHMTKKDEFLYLLNYYFSM